MSENSKTNYIKHPTISHCGPIPKNSLETTTKTNYTIHNHKLLIHGALLNEFASQSSLLRQRRKFPVRPT